MIWGEVIKSYALFHSTSQKKKSINESRKIIKNTAAKYFSVRSYIRLTYVQTYRLTYRNRLDNISFNENILKQNGDDTQTAKEYCILGSNTKRNSSYRFKLSYNITMICFDCLNCPTSPSSFSSTHFHVITADFWLPWPPVV